MEEKPASGRCMFDSADKEQQKADLRRSYENLIKQVEMDRDAKQRALFRAKRNRSPKPKRPASQLEKEIRDCDQKISQLNAQRQQGEEIIDSAQMWQSRDGAICILSKVGSSQPRLKYENRFETAQVAGFSSSFQRLHSQGPGTGFEADVAILYGPEEVNQQLQNRGVESFIRDCQESKADDVILYQTTETRQDAQRLQSITYKLEAERNGKRTTIFESEIMVDYSGKKPKASCSASEGFGQPYEKMTPFLSQPERSKESITRSQQQTKRTAKANASRVVESERRSKSKKASEANQTSQKHNLASSQKPPKKRMKM